jgi:hypothetical protein
MNAPVAIFASKQQVVITLGDGTQIDVRDYAKMWRRVKEAPPGSTFNRSLRSSWIPVTREELLEQFSYGMNDRISRHIPGYGVGRKWDQDWQNSTWRVSRQINHPRLILSWLPPWLKKRFAHRLRENLVD